MDSIIIKVNRNRNNTYEFYKEDEDENDVLFDINENILKSH